MPKIKRYSWRPDAGADDCAPHRCDTALLVVDAIGVTGQEGDGFVENALPAARNLAQMCERAREAGVPVIFVGGAKDVAGFNALVRLTLTASARGASIARLLDPRGDDYFVPTSDPAGFPSPALDMLIEDLGARSLIICGDGAAICTLFGNDEAHLRGHDLYVPSDCVLSAAPEDTMLALYFMRNTLDADLTPSDDLDFAAPE